MLQNQRRRTDSGINDGLAIRILLVCSFILGLLIMVLGVVFRVYVCHWVAKALFGIWIGVFIMITAGVGMCTRVHQSYGPRFGTPCVLSLSFITFVFCFVMVGALSFAMKDFMDDKWFRRPRPYLVVDPDHCVVERHVNYHYYYDTIKQHGRDGLKYGSILIALGLLEMLFTLLRCIFIGRFKELYGKSELLRNQEMQRNAQI